MNEITIDLGKGVKLSAPIKMKMTVEEWIRMTRYIDSILENTAEMQMSKSITLMEK